MRIRRSVVMILVTNEIFPWIDKVIEEEFVPLPVIAGKHHMGKIKGTSAVDRVKDAQKTGA